MMPDLEGWYDENMSDFDYNQDFSDETQDQEEEETTGSWEDDYDMSQPDWYLEIPEDFDFSNIFYFDTYDAEGTKWSCDEEVDMSDPNDCEPCTSYAMWVEAGDGQFKQDDDGKCWSTNEAGSSNGLHLCWEFSGFTEDQAPWNNSETISCWHHDESAQ